MCFYETNYQSATGNYDIYALFMENSYRLINDVGIVSFILPHKFLVADFGEGIRSFFKENTVVEKLIHFGSEMVFKDASTYTCIIDLTKGKKDKLLFKKINPEELFENNNFDSINYSVLSKFNWDLQGQDIFNVIEKIKK